MFHKLTVMVLLTIVFYFPVQAQKSHDDILRFAKNETGDAYHILKAVGDYRFEKFLGKKTTAGILDDLNTIVHESCHHLNHDIGWNSPGTGNREGYFVTQGIEIATKVGPVYNSIELNKFVPDSLKTLIFRYDTYVGAKKNGIWISSQSEGIYGMLNEFTAYYHGTKASMDLFDYYYKNRSDGYQNEDEWGNYLADVASTHFAYYEFRLFMSWYLQYAKLHYPKVYEGCMENRNLRLAFTLVDDLYGQLLTDYHTMLDQLIVNLNKEGEKVSLTNGSLGTMFTVHTGKGGSYGKGIFEDEIQFLKGLLEDKQHDILDEFRLAGASVNNYQTYLAKAEQ
jgi:hypothetical protein